MADQGVLRMYAIDGGNDTKCSEFKGKNGSVADMEVQNKTRLLAVPGFDFDQCHGRVYIECYFCI